MPLADGTDHTAQTKLPHYIHKWNKKAPAKLVRLRRVGGDSWPSTYMIESGTGHDGAYFF